MLMHILDWYGQMDQRIIYFVLIIGLFQLSQCSNNNIGYNIPDPGDYSFFFVNIDKYYFF